MSDMALRFTTNELSFAVPLGVIVGAVIAFFASRQSSRTVRETQFALNARDHELQREMNAATLEAQRRMALDDRLWNKRAGLYLEVIDLSTLDGVQALLHDEEDIGDLMDIADRMFQAYLSGNAAMKLYASRTTREGWDKFGNLTFEGMKMRAALSNEQEGKPPPKNMRPLGDKSTAQALRYSLIRCTLALTTMSKDMQRDLTQLDDDPGAQSEWTKFMQHLQREDDGS